MITLYTAATPNGHKASVTLEELGLAYTVHPLNLMKGEQKAPEFLAINPNNRVPAIVDHDGRRTSVFGRGVEGDGELRSECRNRQLHDRPVVGRLQVLVTAEERNGAYE